MNLIDDVIEDYCEAHTNSISPLLKELERESHLKTLTPQMISGPIQGKFLYFITKISKPKRILEIGAYTGYSTLCFAFGLPENGSIDSIEINEELAPIINRYLKKAKLSSKVKLFIADALTQIPMLDHQYDIALIDAGKLDYKKYFEMILPKMNKGGLIIVDNTLWSGKVVNRKKDIDGNNMDEFNKLIFKDSRVDTSIFPLRDGLTIAQVL